MRITDEAVRDAEKAWRRAYHAKPFTGDDHSWMRAALEAVLPHLEGATPAIDREQIAKALFDYDNRNPLIPRDWSRAMKLERAACLGRADAVLALIGGAS